MNIRELESLNKTLLQTDFETAQILYQKARGQGLPPVKAAALIYRHGFLDGKAAGREKLNELHRRHDELKQRCDNMERNAHMQLFRPGSFIDEDIADVTGGVNE